MRSGAVAVLIALILGVVAGWFLHGSYAPGPTRPNAVDTVLASNPAAQATIDSLILRTDSVVLSSVKKDVVIKKQKARADSFALALARRHETVDTTPETLDSCKMDLADRTGEVTALRAALTPCEEAKRDDEMTIGDMRSTILSQSAWRSDTFPQLIQKERATPRKCTENWILFRVKCSTAGVIKFGAGLTTGILVAR